MGKYKIINDSRGYTKHWYRNENDFTYDGCNYERDEINGRCYRLDPSENMSDPRMDGALVKRRISRAVYEELLEKVQEECRVVEKKRTFYQDRYNQKKMWEVVRLSGGYYLRQYISGKKMGRGIRTTKRYIQSIGIFECEKAPPRK